MPQVEQRRSGMRSEHLLPTDVGRRQRGVSGDSDSDSDDEYGAAARSEDGDGDERWRLAKEVLLGDSEATSRLLEERLYLVVGATGEPSSVSLGAAALGGSTLGGPNDIGERYEILCDSPLHAAARGDDVDTARLLLAAGGDVGAVNVDRATPVHVAARYGHSGVLALLLLSDGRAQVDSVDVDRWTPLHHAAFNGHAECGRLLLEGGATSDPRDSLALTPLHRAASGGHVEVSRCLLQAEPLLMQLHDETLDTPVVGAVRNGHCAVLDVFLAVGLDINATDAFATTLLQLAAFHGQYKMVQHLLVHDAHVEAGGASQNRLLALHLAAMGGHARCVGALLEAGAAVDAVGGVDVNGGGRGQRRTALHLAAAGGHTNTVEVLLGARADPLIKDYQRHTARELAALDSHQPVMKAFDVHAAAGDDALGNTQPRLHKLSESGKGTIVPKAGGRAQARREGRSFGADTLADDAAESNKSIRAMRARAA